MMRHRFFPAALCPILLIVFSFFITGAQASSVGNPANVLDRGSIALDLGFDFTNRTMDSGDELEVRDVKAGVEYGLTNFMTVFASSGFSELKMDIFESSLDLARPPIRFGVRAQAFSLAPRVYTVGRLQSEPLPFELGFDFQAGYYNFDGELQQAPARAEATADFWDIQFAAAAATRYRTLRPYGGIKLSFVRGDVNASTNGSLLKAFPSQIKEDSIPSLFAGTDIDLGSGFEVNVEISVISDFLLHAGVRYTFSR